MRSPGQSEEFSLWRIAVPAYGPTTIWSIGNGASLPILALAARDLGASISLAALFVGLTTLSEFVFAVPAGVLVDRLGERRALIGAGLADALAAALAMWAPNLWVLGAAMVLFGPTGAIFLLARQSYLTALAPPHLRARAMSTLGGVSRMGLFVGPLVGAPIVHRWGSAAGFSVAVVSGILASLLTIGTRDLTGEHDTAVRVAAKVRVVQVARANARILLTVGVGVLAIGLARSARTVVVPLWAEAIGLSAAQVSLVFAAAFGVEVLLFYPAGSIMDHFGRVWVAVPVTVILGGCLLVLPLTDTLAEVAVVALLMGVGNGLGSGIVMTLGADFAPRQGRAQFLGLWRLFSLIGHNGAALVVAAVAALATIGVASATVGVLALVGGGWLTRWLPRHDRARRKRTFPSAAGGPQADQ